MPKMLLPASPSLGMLTFYLVFQKPSFNSKCINSQSESRTNIKTCAFIMYEQDFRSVTMSVRGLVILAEVGIVGIWMEDGPMHMH